jgi:DNA-binding HxlR family transcriptional regulator
MLAGRDEPETVRAALARLDAAMFDPDFDPDAGDWEDGEWAEDEAEVEDEDEAEVEVEWDEEEWEDEDDDEEDASGKHRRLSPALREQLRLPPAGAGIAEPHYVARVLATWLQGSPAGPLRIREEEGMLAIAALVAGWSSTVVHALSGAALTFEELEERTGAVRREALKARIEALEDACLVELLEGPDGEVRYAATPWLRRAIAPLAAAARHECRSGSPESAPPDELDVGAAFLLTLPLVELSAELSGACRLGAWMPHGGRPIAGARQGMAGVVARVESGHVVSVDLKLDPPPRGWAAGSPLDWLETVIDPSAERVDVGGSARLAEALIEGLHALLFGDVIAGGENLLDD